MSLSSKQLNSLRITSKTILILCRFQYIMCHPCEGRDPDFGVRKLACALFSGSLLPEDVPWVSCPCLLGSRAAVRPPSDRYRHAHSKFNIFLEGFLLSPKTRPSVLNGAGSWQSRLFAFRTRHTGIAARTSG